MSTGRTVRIFLPDGSTDGLQTLEIINWSGKALRAKRYRLKELDSRPEIHETGVYILTGPDPDDSSRLRIYVGEGDDIWKRIQSHDSEKGFWEDVLGFISKDGNLTKAHGLYLESRLLSDLKEADQCLLENSQYPKPPNLPESDKSDMEYFLECIKLIVGLSGSGIFSKAKEAKPLQKAQVFEYTTKGAKARMVIADKGYLLLEGSQAVIEEMPSCGASAAKRRKQFVESGVLVEQGGFYVMTKDHLFGSSSGPADLVSGGSISGPQCWKLPDGTALRDWLSSQGT